MRCRRKQRYRHRNATGCLATALSAGAHGIRWVSPSHLRLTSCLTKGAGGVIDFNWSGKHSSKLKWTAPTYVPVQTGEGKSSWRKRQRRVTEGQPLILCFVGMWGLHKGTETLHQTTAPKIICHCSVVGQKKWLIRSSNLQYSQLQYPNHRSSRLFDKVKYVTLYHYKWDVPAYRSYFPDVREHFFRCRPQQKPHLHNFNMSFIEKIKCKYDHSPQNCDSYHDLQYS